MDHTGPDVAAAENATDNGEPEDIEKGVDRGKGTCDVPSRLVEFLRRPGEPQLGNSCADRHCVGGKDGMLARANGDGSTADGAPAGQNDFLTIPRNRLWPAAFEKRIRKTRPVYIRP